MKPYAETWKSAGIELPVPWNLDAFLAMLSDKIGKAVVIEPFMPVDGLGGYLYNSKRKAVIALRKNSFSDRFEMLDLGHEVGHLVLGHDRCDTRDWKNEEVATDFGHEFVRRYEQIVFHGQNMSVRQARIINQYVRYLEGN